jgi:hypothetical protein
MIDPGKVCLYIPPELKKFTRIGEAIVAKGGRVIHGDYLRLNDLPDDIIPIVGCTPALRPLIDAWTKLERKWTYWDRGYARRVFASWLPHGTDGGFYRWERNNFQMQRIKEVPGDRWAALKTDVSPWRKNGKHIVVAIPTPTYSAFHNIQGWTEQTLATLGTLTDRPLVVRDKETKRPLQFDLDGAHALVSHGSNAATEAAILGTPVYVDPCSAASLVGLTDLSQIERPIYPDRTPWVHSLAYSQFDEAELVDGTLWRLLD